MFLSKVCEILNAEVCCGEDKMDVEVLSACGSDFMSDVLAFVKNQAVLLTGMINPQVIRTAEMMDMKCIVFVRGKHPTPEMLSLARSCGIVVMSTALPMYSACGELYKRGLQGGSSR